MDRETHNALQLPLQLPTLLDHQTKAAVEGDPHP